jgi:hypothetical protein
MPNLKDGYTQSFHTSVYTIFQRAPEYQLIEYLIKEIESHQ